MTTDSQSQYWKLLEDAKYHEFYLETFLRKYQAIERRVKYLMAITSSASIAGWAIWSKFSFVWAVIIASSQLLNTIQHFLPYSERVKLISQALPKLNRLSLRIEDDLYQVKNGELTDYEIHRVTIRFREEINEIETRLRDNLLPDSSKIADLALTLTEQYLKNHHK